jgi:hypothetical protein
MSALGKKQHGTGSRPGVIGRGVSMARRLPRGRRAAAGFRRRHRGISATELRGFNKVARLLRRVGMVPKATRRRPVHRS